MKTVALIDQGSGKTSVMLLKPRPANAARPRSKVFTKLSLNHINYAIGGKAEQTE